MPACLPRERMIRRMPLLVSRPSRPTQTRLVLFGRMRNQRESAIEDVFPSWTVLHFLPLPNTRSV